MKKFWLSVYIVGSLCVLCSCNEEEILEASTEGTEAPGEITITPGFVSYAESQTRAGSRSVGEAHRVSFHENFDEKNMLQVVIEEKQETTTRSARGKLFTGSMQLVVMKDKQIVGQEKYTVANGSVTGNSLTIPNVSGKLTFHCYSPASSATNSGQVTVRFSDEAFVYWTVEKTVNAGQSVHLEPKLSPKSSQVEIVIDTRGFDSGNGGEFSEDKEVISTFKDVEFNGKVSTQASWSLNDQQFSNIQSLSAVSYRTAKKKNLIPDRLEINWLEIKDLKILSTQGGKLGEKASYRVNPGINKILESGKSYSIKFLFRKKKYLEFQNPDLRVALANVTFSSEPWRNRLSANQGSFNVGQSGGAWISWGQNSINGDAYSYHLPVDAMNDACAKAFDGDRNWRLPTSAEMQLLMKDGVYWVKDGDSYPYQPGLLVGRTSLPLTDKMDDYIFLPAAGYLAGNALYGTPKEINKKFFYWCSDKVVFTGSSANTLKVESYTSGNSYSVRCVSTPGPRL